MRANQVLVRWQDGWTWVESATFPRIEICQGQAGDSEEVVKKANAELVRYMAGETELTVGLDLLPSDPVPGIDWIEGDEVEVGAEGTFEVEAMTFTMDDATGRVAVVPQFGSVLDASSDRISRSISAIGGLTGGTSRLARPIATLANPNLRPS